MIIVMSPNAPRQAIDRVVGEIERTGSPAHLSQGQFRTVIGAVGEEGQLDQNHLAVLDGVEKVLPIMTPYKLASGEFHEDDSVVEVGGGSVPVVKVGGRHAACMAGPCAVENQNMLGRIVRDVRAGVMILRGGSRFKPRTSPYSFQGHGEKCSNGCDCGDELGMPIVTEVMDTRQVELIERYADMFQIGARNMQNFDLLREVGKTRKPVLLKRLALVLRDHVHRGSAQVRAGGVLDGQGRRAFFPLEGGLHTQVFVGPLPRHDRRVDVRRR